MNKEEQDVYGKKTDRLGILLWNVIYYQKKFEEAKKALDDAYSEQLKEFTDDKSVQ